MKTQRSFVLGLTTLLALSLSACAPSKQQLKQTLIDNPDIITEVIDKNPLKVMEALNKAAQNAREEQSKQAEANQKAEMDQEFKNPKKPVIDEARAISGPKTAPITIVEYSDFQCPYCQRGFTTVKEVKQKYGDKVRIHFKHLPLPFHPMAMPGAKYFEAIALQSPEKAYKFHDLVFGSQDKLNSEGEKAYEKWAKQVGVDMKKLKADLDSPKVMERINADKEEAAKFGFSGTPGFLINGVSLRGAYPAPEFEKIIDRMLAENK